MFPGHGCAGCYTCLNQNSVWQGVAPWKAALQTCTAPASHPQHCAPLRPHPAQDKAAAHAALLEWVDADVLPAEYGGTSQAGIYDDPLEQRFWAHVANRNAGSKGGVGDSSASMDRPGTPTASDAAR